MFSRSDRTMSLLVLALVCSFSFGAMVRVAAATHYHTNCVGHGFAHGSSVSDNSFFARVEPGCGSTLRTCHLYAWGSHVGGQTVTGTTAMCNAWSRSFGNFTECASTAHTYNQNVFVDHVHKAENWCA